MSASIYDDVIRTESEGMNRERVEVMVEIYESVDHDFRTETNTQQPLQSKGSDRVKSRSSRAAPVCLVLLCVLLLTAVIVLSVYIQTKNRNYTEEREQLLNNITNFTEEREQLQTKITNFTEEREQLLTKITNFTEEREQLLTNISKLTEEREQLLTNITNFTEESEQLQITIKTLKTEKDQIEIKNQNVTNEMTELLSSLKNYDLIKCLDEMDGWIYYRSSFYYISSEKKNWIESRRYCTERGADLIIINNREEQDFVQKLSAGASVWIGLTDSDVEDRWKWVDGTNMNSGFWRYGEPNGGRGQNCVLTYSSGWSYSSQWADYPCKTLYQWICEKTIKTSH